MPLDDPSKSLLEQRTNSMPLYLMKPTDARMFIEAAAAARPAGPEMYSTEDLSISTSMGSVSVKVLTPSRRPLGTVVYFHGGGWVTGSIRSSEPLGRALALRTGCVVLLVGYGLAPEQPYPLAIEHASAALRWAEARCAKNGTARRPLIVAGDSAGGNLAAVVALRAARGIAPRVDLQILVNPVTDCDLDRPSYRSPENNLSLTKTLMRWFWDQYIPDKSRREEPEASPLRATDLSNLAPAVILTAEYDVLRDEGEAYADRLEAEGVRVFRRRFLGQMHGFVTQVGILPGSAAALDYIARTIAEILT